MKKFINPTSIVITAIIITIVSCFMLSPCLARVNAMQDEIIKCEAFLDTLDSRMPFMDTIGETDDYQYLCEAYDEFQDAKADLDEHNMKIAYKKYRKYWKECVNAALAIEVELKKRE